MFCVVQLDSDFLKAKIVVPSLWLDKYNTLCLLPPTSDVAEIVTFAKAQTSPKHGWKMHSISFIQSFDTYSQAEENIKKNESKSIMVELDKKEEAEKGQRRKRKRPSFLENYAPETEDDDEQSRKTRKEFCFVEGNLSCIDTAIVKVEMAADSSTSESKRQPQNTTENIGPSNSSFLHKNDALMAESSLSKISPSGIPMKCPCNSSCHKLFFQSLATLQKQLEDSNQMLCHIMTQLKTAAPVSSSLPGSPIGFPMALPVKHLSELQTLNLYLSNPRNFVESIPYFTGLGGSLPRQILKRIMEGLLSRDLSAKMNWKGRGDKHPFNIYTKMHSFVHHVAKQNTRAAHITLTEVENFMKDWLKMAPLKNLKSVQKKEPPKEERVFQC